MDNRVIKMVKLFCFLISYFLLQSCSSTKNNQKYSNNTNLSNSEKNIINIFLEKELTNKVYTYYRNDSIILIGEALSKKQVIEDYASISNYSEHSFFDTIQISNLKKTLENEPIYYWKKTDFNNKKISLQTPESYENFIKNEEYLKSPNKLFFYLSTPFFIDKKRALITFISGSSLSGFNLINSAIVLLEENENGLWKTKYLGSRYY